MQCSSRVFFFFFKTLCGIYSILIACESISYFLFCVSLLVWVSWSYFLACLAIFYELWRQSCKGWGCCLWQAGGRCKEYLDPAESRLLTLLGQVCPSPHTPGAVLVESPGGLLGPLCLARPWMSSLSLALQSPERSLLKSRHPTAVFCLGSADLVLPTRGLRACECIEGKFHEEFWPRFLAAPSSSQTELSSWFPAALAAPRPTSIPQLSPKPGSAFSFRWDIYPSSRNAQMPQDAPGNALGDWLPFLWEHLLLDISKPFCLFVCFWFKCGYKLSCP